MDSMRSLDTTLPRARRRQQASQTDTTQSFRSAALTVTNLYKAALADIDRARADGYQDALEDLISLLDRENLGVRDGEGWRIRQWATERLDGQLPPHSTSDSDEEIPEENRARSSSPVMERVSSPEEIRANERTSEDPSHRSDSAPPPASNTPEVSHSSEPSNNSTMFHFSSPHTLPTTNSTDASSYDFAAASRRAFAAPRRSTNRSSRSLQRNAAQNLLSLGNGAGQKRKIMQDFFNIDLNDRRDGPGSGGGKRGRMT